MLILILTAPGSGHLAIEQGFALAMGSNLGTTTLTAIIGALRQILAEDQQLVFFD